MTLGNKVILTGSGAEVTANEGTLILTSEVSISNINFKPGNGSKVLI